MYEKKELRRSSTDKMLFGVLGGLAEYMNVSSSLLRILFVLFSLLPGPSIIFYIIFAVLMPSDRAYRA